MSRLKTIKLGKSQSNQRDIIQWCEERIAIPDDLDQVFCGGIDYNIDEEDQLQHLRIVITTSRLQMNQANKIIATDGTYKLNYNGYPILMVGTVDLKRQYHPYGIMITKTESSEDYQFMFSRLKVLAQDIGATEFDPTVLLADAASEITNGYAAGFKLGNFMFILIG